MLNVGKIAGTSGLILLPILIVETPDIALRHPIDLWQVIESREVVLLADSCSASYVLDRRRKGVLRLLQNASHVVFRARNFVDS
jgi:hypothetical protein